MRPAIGRREICHRCEHEIEWHGRKFGWIDRGAGRQCLPYITRGGDCHAEGKARASTASTQESLARILLTFYPSIALSVARLATEMGVSL